MHLYIMTRGVKTWVDQFITELQGKYLPFKWRKPGTTDLQDVTLQVSVRPIQLWEIVFPEEHKDLICSTLLDDFTSNPGKYTQHKEHNKFIWGIRKALGAEEIKYKKVMMMPITKQNIEVVGIGLKKDYWIDKEDKHHDKKVEGSFEGI